MVLTDDILAVTQNVMGTMLQFNIVPSDEHEMELHDHRMTGCVQISGEWSGAVILQTTEEFASRAAAAMLMVKPSDVSHADRQDSIAELTNMIGGNIKSIVPGPSFLSMPSVTTGNDFDFKLVGADVINSVPLQCDGELCRVILCQGATLP